MAGDVTLGEDTLFVPASSTATLPVTFIEDGVALEDPIESATLQLALLEDPLPSSVIFKDSIQLLIMDTNGEESLICGGVSM